MVFRDVIYLTQSNELEDLPLSLFQELAHKVEFSQHRPDWEYLFGQLSRVMERPHCFVCGPLAMTMLLRRNVDNAAGR
jgi:hypothetical protein